MAVKVKICGVTDHAAADAAAEAGASFIGVVFFPASPRHVEPDRAAEIFEFLPAGVARVGLFVDADDQQLHQALAEVRLDYLQLHGQESPARVEEIRQEFGIPVIKALGVAAAADLNAALAYDGVADLLLFDAKPPPAANRPGGLGAAFDWSLLSGRRWRSPWFLAGGLTATTVPDAIQRSGARLVDVSSGVELAAGVKDAALVKSFIAAAQGASHV
jgi:phosphoribosylanthranilate isomerase